MAKYNQYSYRQVKERRWKIHPVWRGIGCIMLIIVPIMSCAGGRLFQQENARQGWFSVPEELTRSIDPVYSVNQALGQVASKVPGLAGITNAISGVIPATGPVYYLELAAALAFVILGFGILTALYSMMYASLGPSRYGPVDSPPIKKSPHRKR